MAFGCIVATALASITGPARMKQYVDLGENLENVELSKRCLSSFSHSYTGLVWRQTPIGWVSYKGAPRLTIYQHYRSAGVDSRGVIAASRATEP
jgi:hypothetical protein